MIEESYSLEYSYNTLRRFVARAQLSELTDRRTASRPTTSLAWLDNRRDPLGRAQSTRNWDEYDARSPKGDREWSDVLDAFTLYDKLMEKVFQSLDIDHAVC